MRKALLFTTMVVVILLATPFQALAQDITRFGSDVTVPEGEVQEGNITVFGGDVVIEGEAGADVTVFGGDLRINGRVGGSVTHFGGDTTLGNEAVIGGDFTQFGGTVNRAPGARIEGSETTGPRIFSPFVNFLASLFALLFTLALTVAVVAILPEQTRVLANTVEQQPLPSLGYGILATILVPLLFLILALIIIVGWILIPFVAIAVVITYFYGYVGVARWLGDRIIGATRSANQSPIVKALVGALVLGVIGLVPILGGLVQFIAAMIGLGAVLISKYGTGKPWRRQEAAQAPPPEKGVA